MNGRKARTIRAIAQFEPSAPRKYTLRRGTVANAVGSPRYLQQSIKRRLIHSIKLPDIRHR